MSVKNALNFFQMFEQYWGCLDKMSDVNFNPAETLCNCWLHMLLYQFENKKFECLSYRKKTLKLSYKLAFL